MTPEVFIGLLFVVLVVMICRPYVLELIGENYAPEPEPGWRGADGLEIIKAAGDFGAYCEAVLDICRQRNIEAPQWAIEGAREYLPAQTKPAEAQPKASDKSAPVFEYGEKEIRQRAKEILAAKARVSVFAEVAKNAKN